MLIELFFSSSGYHHVLIGFAIDLWSFFQGMHIAAAVEANSRLLPKLHGLHEALVSKVRRSQRLSLMRCQEYIHCRPLFVLIA